ncbi:MAG: hypothetical protein EXR73_00565 [Myxococcales bacterium]|nr:hypothetical protein [Myxococcales bacterium]
MWNPILLAACFVSAMVWQTTDPTTSSPAKPDASGPQDAEAEVTRLIAQASGARATFDEDSAVSELVKLGASAVAPLQRRVEERAPEIALAMQALVRMGEPARPALPLLLAILGDRDFIEPASQLTRGTARGHIFDVIDEAKWAVAEVAPILALVAANSREEEGLRRRSLWALGGFGEVSAPALAAFLGDVTQDIGLRQTALSALGKTGVDASDAVRPIADQLGHPLRNVALHVLAAMEEAAARQSQFDFWSGRMATEPEWPLARGWLRNACEATDPATALALARQVEASWRERLAAKPDAELAFAIAMLCHDQLHDSQIDWAGRHEYRPKRDPRQNYPVLADALRVAKEQAEKWTPRWQRSLRGLAAVALARGDWDGMNAALVELGLPPMPAEQRQWLTPPHESWAVHPEKWVACDEAMRNGDCSFELRIEKEGRGVAGVHVRLHELPRDDGFRSSGVDTSTLFYNRHVVAEDHWTGAPALGYQGRDRQQCRYVVTGDDGIARFEQLPEIDVEIEVMVPTGNFTEPIAHWELWSREADGTLSPRSYRWHEGFQLISGETVAGPTLVVRPRFAMNLVEGQALDAQAAVLSWDATPPLASGVPVRYEVSLSLGFPGRKRIVTLLVEPERLATAIVTTTATTLSLADPRFATVPLEAGNVYVVAIVARDEQDVVLARYGSTVAYVPWRHRVALLPVACDPEIEFHEDFASIALESKVWHLGQYHSARGKVETLPQWIDRRLAERPDAFEREYLEVARAWLHWTEGDAATARAALAVLANALPAGNLAGATAAQLIRRIDASEAPGKELQFGLAER